MVAADAGKRAESLYSPVKGKHHDQVAREVSAGLKLPSKLHRQVREVGESAKHRVIEKWSRVVRAKEEARDRVTQLRKRWQVFRPRLRPARAVRFLVKTVKPATPTLQQKLTHTLGVGVVMVTCFMAGSAPQNLPLMYLIFCVCTIPCRTCYFFQRNWQFFLIDYCYFVNALVVAFLLVAPNDPRVQATVWSMAQGPVAGAIVVWRCSWVFGFADHMVSVLIHILPGLSVLAHIHFRRPHCEGELLKFACKAPPLEGGEAAVSFWMWGVVAPLGSYCIWQGAYFVIVQVWYREKIEMDKKIDTSYRNLARRAARSSSWVNRLVWCGRPARRVLMYGVVQAAYTVLTTAVAAALYSTVWPAFVWQNLQVVAAVWNGAEYVYDMQPRMMEKKWRARLHAETRIPVESSDPTAREAPDHDRTAGNGDGNAIEDCYDNFNSDTNTADKKDN